MSVGIDQLIEVDVKGGFVLTLSPLARNLDIFKAIIVRDKGSETDSQGRKKLRAMNEIIYCYLMEKYGSPFHKFEESKRHSEITRRLQVSIDPEDELILDLRHFLKSFQITPSFEALTAIKESYHSSTKMLHVMRKLLERMIVELQEFDWSSEDEDAPSILDKLSDANRLLKDIRGNAMDFDNILKLISSLEEKVKAEQQEKDKVIKGGGEPLKYED